jgi:hypothetical protein
MLKTLIKVDHKIDDEDETYSDPNKQVIKDEEKELGKIDYGVCIDFFAFCDKKYGGKNSVFLILFLHVVINVSAISLSLYLAYALSDFNQTNVLADGSREQKDLSQNHAYIPMLLFIMFLCFFTTVLGKYVSTLIFMSINRNIHEKVVKSLINTKM